MITVFIRNNMNFLLRNNMASFIKFKTIISSVFEYDTPKIVHIKNKKVGILNRCIQLLIISYVIGYVIIYNKGYHEYDSVQSVVVSKVKGTSLTIDPEDIHLKRIWDNADYVIPPQENGAFFVMTKVLVSPNQTMGLCGEDWNLQAAICTNDTNLCMKYKGEQIPRGNGIATGKCIEISPQSHANFTGRVCEIFGWCPTEEDNAKFAVSMDTRNFTVMIKNNIEFPRFKVKRRNIVNKYQDNNCIFDPKDDPYCPIFKLETFAILSNEDYSLASKKGAIFSITIKWDCDLDKDIDYCKPSYQFHRLDSQNDQFSPGWNFRYADHYEVDGIRTRNLYKSYGLRFVIIVEGRAGRFYIVNLGLQLASGIALLAIATVVTDIALIYLLPNREVYKRSKYYLVTDDSIELNEKKKIRNYNSTTPLLIKDDD